ncbi:hypothetical protein [Asanoa iriomotensis]|uniref:Bacterial Death-like domain-containing protein n=1 Tax=Asanoa iriomotensis TaxID=234613 RepID=A0ABQ4CCC7_9ACTN|nr:hypothetical protein [Asanoa iriomotensis]GIF60131.1 hypothetical protein Air01nite_62260 [Asanoa iriomotensis]
MAENNIYNSGGGSISISGVVGDNSSVTHGGQSTAEPEGRTEAGAADADGGRSPYSGPTKWAFIRRLDSSCHELADYLDIPTQGIPDGPAGSRQLWDALESRDMFEQLPAALEAIDRPDLTRLLAEGRRK